MTCFIVQPADCIAPLRFIEDVSADYCQRCKQVKQFESGTAKNECAVFSLYEMIGVQMVKRVTVSASGLIETGWLSGGHFADSFTLFCKGRMVDDPIDNCPTQRSRIEKTSARNRLRSRIVVAIAWHY